MHQYLEQAGVKNDLVRLQDVGLKGNGHLMNVELNSDQIAQFLIDWLATYGVALADRDTSFGAGAGCRAQSAPAGWSGGLSVTLTCHPKNTRKRLLIGRSSSSG